MSREARLRVFFGVAACSWMPHWSCHYYRLETGSSFAVGSWEFSPTASVLNMLVYALLIALSLAAIVTLPLRPWSAALSGLLHLTVAGVHALRLVRPFRLEVFGFPWPQSASVREVAIMGVFGIVCLAVAWMTGRRG